MNDKKSTGYRSTGYRSTGNGSTGNGSTGNWSTGNWSTGNRSTGNWSTGNRSTGDRSAGNWSTGDRSAGDWSTGDRSAGDGSTGNRSTGDRSAGNWSTGDRSAGDGSTGNGSTGNWSISNYSTGHFSTEDYAGFGAFNKPCTSEEWDSVVKPFFLFQIRPTKWIPVSDMTYAEKAGCSTFHTTGGYTKTIPMKESWAEAWANRGENDEAQLRALPNFDAGVFKEISGIDVNANLCDKCKQPLDDKCSSCGQDITT